MLDIDIRICLFGHHIFNGLVKMINVKFNCMNCFRGQMRPLKGENDQKLANGKNINVESNNENVVGCCQGVDGVSCCKSESFEQNKVVDETDNNQESNVSRGKKWIMNLLP